MGSSPDAVDDVVECMIVGNSSRCVMIVDGKIHVTSDEHGVEAYNISEFLLPVDDNGTLPSGSRLSMEPGRYGELKFSSKGLVQHTSFMLYLS